VPPVSASGVTPSLLKSVKVVPAGNVLPPSVMSKASAMLPRLVSVFSKATVVPGAAEARRWPTSSTSIRPDTVYETVLVARSMPAAPLDSAKAKRALL
jgi:hypothetical protein